MRPAGRFFLIDAIKAAGCMLIVLHHLAFYGPMSDVVATAFPALVAGLYDHGRLAVQLFLVCGGFLTAASLVHLESVDLMQALKLAWQRYLRLAIPLLAALSFTVLVTEWVRPDFAHDSLSAPPEWGQALAHMALLQHLLGQEALSAGIWYVAIDLQLYVLVLLSGWVVNVAGRAQSLRSRQVWRWVLCLGLTCASLWGWNLQPDWDNLGLYFFGAYGLGMLAWEGRRRIGDTCDGQQWGVWALCALWVVLGAVAWWIEPRSRVAVAWGVAGLLALLPQRWFSGEAMRTAGVRQMVRNLSKVSYSVFLIHFGVSLLVNAGVTAWWPEALWANALGMWCALCLSWLCGACLYHAVERHAPTVWRWWLWAGVFKASVALALMVHAGAG